MANSVTDGVTDRLADRLADRLLGLRAYLAEAGLEGFVVWRDDMFMGEEVRPCDERLAMISGFGGSAGYALIMADNAVVFSDGRYHLQLENQLDKAIWQWADSTPDALLEAIKAEVIRTGAIKAKGDRLTIGFDATTTSLAKWRKLPTQVDDKAINWQGLAENPLDNLWQDRPAPHRSPAWPLADDVAGQSAAQKIAALQDGLVKSGHDGIIISAVDCVNWLLNIRGDDLSNTPFHLSFAYVPQSGAPVLIEGDCASYTSQSWQAFCADLGAGRYSIDAASLPMALYHALQKEGVTLVEEACPLYLPKARKNETELAGFREAHKTDALSLCRFWYWLDNCADITGYRETDLVAKLQQERAQADSYLCDSFETIMGAGANGAIIHYRAEAGKDSAIENDNLLLIDSGGHYQTGTTDITRTFIIGAADEEMRAAYSAVLAGHIALAMARFPKGTNGAAIDAICRAPLWASGRDYAHGTGHGVGHILSVHEGPCHIAKRQGPALEEGMVLSNEPGFYEAGKWGIRLENLVAVVAFDKDYLGFETLTFVPFEAKLIDKKMLGKAACDWLDAYHAQIYEMLAPQLADEGMRGWLAAKCAPLS